MENQEYYFGCVNFKMLFKKPVDKYPAGCWVYDSGVLGHVWILRYRCGSDSGQVLFKAIGLKTCHLESPGHLVVEEEKRTSEGDCDEAANNAGTQLQAHGVLDIKRWESFVKKSEQLCWKQWKGLVKERTVTTG